MMDKQLLAGALLFCSLQAFGTDFSEADAKFARRDFDLATTLAARAAYKSILDVASKDADKLRAAEGFLRTFLYEGTHYHSLDTAEGQAARKVVFEDCWANAAESIRPTALGFETPAYYYFRTACLAYDAQVSTYDQQLELIPPLVDGIQKGLILEDGTNYEAGGLFRVAAAVKYNPAAKPLPGGLYNPEEALQLIDFAIAAQPLGSLYCENFSHKARNLLVLERPVEALTLIESSITGFEAHLGAGEIPEYFRAETLDCLILLRQLKSVLSQ